MVRPPKFEIQQDGSDSTLTLSIIGELDINTAVTLSQCLDEQFSGQPTALMLDLRDLVFMDSSGLRLLIALNDRSQREAWQFKLIAPRHEVALMVLRATGADAALPLENDDS